MALVCAVMVSFIFARIHAYSSLLTDGENKTSTTLETKGHAWNDVDFLRQMINQETVIRLALVKNVQALVSDVSLMKKSITASELTISALRQSIETLNARVDSLERENKRRTDSNVDFQERILDLESQLQTVNKSVISLNENLYTSQKESDEKRQNILNKINGVLDDIKMEVRYLSVTLFDLKEDTTTSDERKDKKLRDISNHLNTSIETLRADDIETKRKFHEMKAFIKNQEEVQREFQKAMTENQTTTIAGLETQAKKSEYEMLKLSSAVSSLEAFKMNMTTSKCGKNMNIAFTVGISTNDDNWLGDILVFPDIIYSEGNGYDSNTGVFTAITEGTYLFYISIQSAFQKYSHFDIVLNGSAKVQSLAWYDGGSTIRIHQTGTNLVILHLKTGDRVWVKRNSGAGYYSNSHHVTTFSGIRLY